MKARLCGSFLFGLVALLLALPNPVSAELCYKDSDETNPGQGVPVKWLNTDTKKVDYYTYVPATEGKLPTDRAKVLEAIKAAFAAYEAVTCSTLKFNHAGAMTSLDVTEKKGAILVYFGHNSETLTFTGAYRHYLKFSSLSTGAIESGVIAMNAQDHKWVIGKETNAIDIQSAVMRMIPDVVGIHVGPCAASGKLKSIGYNAVDHDVAAEAKTGIQYVYHDSADSNCTQPTKPAVCGKEDPPECLPPDGGTTNLDGGAPIGGEPSISVDAGGGGGGSDEGCCRISHARTTDLWLPLLLCALFLLGQRRRLRR